MHLSILNVDFINMMNAMKLIILDGTNIFLGPGAKYTRHASSKGARALLTMTGPSLMHCDG